MTCTYCKQESQDLNTCDFCKADLSATRPKMNNSLSELEAERTQPELAQMHTYDLMLILSHIRQKRTESYKLMQTVRKAPDEAKNDNYEELKEYGIETYRQFTAQKNVIEQILVDRMGYFPKRVDEKLLGALKSKIDRYHKTVKS